MAKHDSFVDNSLSQAQTSKEGSLLLVGDVKQAIYRWRGGNPEQFLSLIHEKSAFDTADPVIENLPKNYRSLKEIIDPLTITFSPTWPNILEDPSMKNYI